MRVRLQRQAKPGLLARAVVEPAPPVREVDHPAALRRRVGFCPVLVPLIGSGRQDDNRRDLKRRVEMLELWNDIPFQMLAGFGAHVEGHYEESPVLETIAKIRDVLRLELKEELAYTPSLRPRLKGDSCGRLPNPDARHEAE